MESVLFGSAAVYALGEGQAVCTTLALLVAVMAWLVGHSSWILIPVVMAAVATDIGLTYDDGEAEFGGVTVVLVVAAAALAMRPMIMR